MNGFAGKVLIVTGAGGGVGQALCRQLARSGARVVGVGRTAEKLEQALQAMHDAGGEGSLVTGDITDPATADQAMAAAEAFGGLDVLVNNAGVGLSFERRRPGSMSDLASQSPQLWREVIDINLTGAAIMTRAAIPALLKRGGEANIVFVSSIMGFGGFGSGHAYSAAKAGLINLVQSLAVTHGPAGLRTNCVAPGLVDTEMVADVIASGIFERPATRYALSPMGRAATPDEIANVVLFLASPAASYVNGAVLAVDGGASAKF